MKIIDQLRNDFPGNSLDFKSEYHDDGEYKGYYMIVNDQQILLHITSGYLKSMDLHSEKGKTLYWMFVKYMIDLFQCEPAEGSLADSLRFTIDEEKFMQYFRRKSESYWNDDSRNRYEHVQLPEYEGTEEEIYQKIMEENKGKFDDLRWDKDEFEEKEK